MGSWETAAENKKSRCQQMQEKKVAKMKKIQKDLKVRGTHLDAVKRTEVPKQRIK